MKSAKEIVEEKYLKFAIAGFVILLLELTIETGLRIYPEFVQDQNILPKFQLQALNLFYGATVEGLDTVKLTSFRISLFSDYIGYLLIILGCRQLKKRTRVFSLATAMSVLAIAIKLTIHLLPFFFGGVRLCYIVMVLGIALLGAEISVGYFFVCGVCNQLPGIAFRSDRVTIGIAWFVTVVCQIIVFVTTWLILTKLTFAYNLMLLWIYVFYLYCVWKLRDYITGKMSV